MTVLVRLRRNVLEKGLAEGVLLLKLLSQLVDVVIFRSHPKRSWPDIVAEPHDAGPCCALLSHLAARNSLGQYPALECFIGFVVQHCLIKIVQYFVKPPSPFAQASFAQNPCRPERTLLSLP